MLSPETRPWVRWAWVVGAALAALGAFFVVRALRASPCEVLADTADLAPDTVYSIRCAPLFVVAADPPIVLFAEMHLSGELARWDPDRRVFFSDLHGEEYQVNGSKLRGPGGSMEHCPYHLDGTRIVLDAEPTVEGLREVCS